MDVCRSSPRFRRSGIVGAGACCAAAVAVLSLVGCGSADAPVAASGAATTGTFVGRIGDDGPYVALVVGRDVVVGLVADGADGIAEPFSGARNGDDVSLATAGNGAVEFVISDEAASGTVRLNSTDYPVELTPAADDAGLFRAAGLLAGEPVWGTWIVVDAEHQGGAAGTSGGVVLPPPIDPATRTFRLEDAETGETLDVEVVQVVPDDAPGTIEDPGSAFEGGVGFQGGVGGFGGFTGFGGGQFNRGFSGGQFQGGFGGGGGFNSGFNSSGG